MTTLPLTSTPAVVIPPNGTLLRIKGLYYAVSNHVDGADLYLIPPDSPGVPPLNSRARLSRSGLYALKGQLGERYLYHDGKLIPSAVDMDMATEIKSLLRIFDELFVCRRLLAHPVPAETDADLKALMQLMLRQFDRNHAEGLGAAVSPALWRRVDDFRAEFAPR